MVLVLIDLVVCDAIRANNSRRETHCSRRYDCNGDGTLNQREFEAALAEQKVVLTKDEKAKFFKKVDASGDDLVDYKVLIF